jgi:excisionase family DNA binding protein
LSEKAVAPLALSIPEALDALGISRQTLYDEINAHRLRTYRVGRRRFVSRAALLDWIQEREQEGRRSVA